MGRRRRRSQWVLVSLAMRGAGEKMRAGSREKSVSRGGERICCIQSGIGEFCQDGVFSSQDQGVTTENDRSRFIGRTGGQPFPFKGGGRDLCRIRRGKVLVERKTEIRDKRTLGEAQTEGKWVPAAKRCDLVGVKPGLGGENRRLVV